MRKSYKKLGRPLQATQCQLTYKNVFTYNLTLLPMPHDKKYYVLVDLFD